MTAVTSALFAPPDDARPAEARRSLVLAGGGMRVAYQAGVLAALEQAGLRFHHVDGASGGTMNLSMLLGGQDSAEIGQRWRTLRQRDFSALLPWRDYARSLRWPRLGGARGLREKVFRHLGIIPMRPPGHRVIGRTTRATSPPRRQRWWSTRTSTWTAGRRGVPAGLDAGRDAGGTPYTDAVWIRDSNVPAAVARGSDEIWLVWCIGDTPAYHNGLFRQYVHMIEMAANGSLLRDLEYVGDRWPRRPVRLNVIKPEHPYPSTRPITSAR